MFDILNEVQYIKDVLAKGFGKKWITDAGIYVRYCKLEGFSKEETKEKLKEKMEKYVVGYNEYKYYKITDNILKRYWKIEEPFREINQIDIPIKVLDWFYENNDLKIKEKKVLFTLYCWAQLQKQAGIEFYKYINLNRFMARFKKEANVSTSSSLRRNELNHLGYLGYLKMTEKNASYECKFLDTSSFNIVDKDIEILNGKYLQNFGDFINDYMINKSNKNKYGTFKCQRCGKEFGHYNNSSKEKTRKYCRECSDIVYHNKFDGDMKIILCKDCNAEVVISVKDNSTCRCKECQDKVDREKKLEWWNKNKEKYR